MSFKTLKFRHSNPFKKNLQYDLVCGYRDHDPLFCLNLLLNTDGKCFSIPVDSLNNCLTNWQLIQSQACHRYMGCLMTFHPPTEANCCFVFITYHISVDVFTDQIWETDNFISVFSAVSVLFFFFLDCILATVHLTSLCWLNDAPSMNKL